MLRSESKAIVIHIITAASSHGKCLFFLIVPIFLVIQWCKITSRRYLLCRQWRTGSFVREVPYSIHCGNITEEATVTSADIFVDSFSGCDAFPDNMVKDGLIRDFPFYEIF